MREYLSDFTNLISKKDNYATNGIIIGSPQDILLRVHEKLHLRTR